MLKVRDQKGFTLIELLIVIAIIAILAAIAIPQFSEYRAKSLEAAMVTDARNASTTMESIFSDCQDYTVVDPNLAGPAIATITSNSAAPSPCAVAGQAVSQNVRVSANNTLRVTASDPTTYTVQVSNANARPNRQNVTIDNNGAITWGP